MTIEYHLVTTENTTLLDNVDPDVFDNAIVASQTQAFVNDNRHVLFVAVDDGLVIGMATGVEMFHPDKQPQLFINEVGVAERYRRRGIGRHLTGLLLDVARGRGCDYAWLGTEDDNVAARACYASVPGVSEPEPFVLFEWDLD